MLHGIIHVQYIENVHRVYVHVQVPRFWNFNQLKPSLKGYKITIPQWNPAYMYSYERGQSSESFAWGFKSTGQTEFESQGFKFDYANFNLECWCLKHFPNFNLSLKGYNNPKPEPNSEYRDSNERGHSPESFETGFKKIGQPVLELQPLKCGYANFNLDCWRRRRRRRK